MKKLSYLVSLGALAAPLMITVVAHASKSLPNCPAEPFAADGGGASAICQQPHEPPPPPPPPPEPNRLADSSGNPLPGQNRCGDDQIPVADCPSYQDIAYFTSHCINGTEYNYARSHSIAPLCSQISPTTYIGFCFCGCLERSTGILVKDAATGVDGVQPIDQILAGAVQVHALTEDATLSAVRFAPRAVETTTAGAEHEPLVVLHLEGGVTLAATQLHAILLSEGKMVAAKDLVVGQQLVKQDGAPSAILDITHERTSEDVFNVLASAGLSHKGHMIVANGVIVGDLMWQNTLAKDLNSIVVRQ